METSQKACIILSDVNAQTPPDDGHVRFGELASDALRYWEPRRLLYNITLSAVVLVHFLASWPASKAFLTRDTFFGFFLFGRVGQHRLLCGVSG